MSHLCAVKFLCHLFRWWEETHWSIEPTLFSEKIPHSSHCGFVTSWQRHTQSLSAGFRGFMLQLFVSNQFTTSSCWFRQFLLTLSTDLIIVNVKCFFSCALKIFHLNWYNLSRTLLNQQIIKPPQSLPADISSSLFFFSKGAVWSSWH